MGYCNLKNAERMISEGNGELWAWPPSVKRSLDRTGIVIRRKNYENNQSRFTNDICLPLMLREMSNRHLTKGRTEAGRPAPMAVKRGRMFYSFFEAAFSLACPLRRMLRFLLRRMESMMGSGMSRMMNHITDCTQ